MLEANVSVEEKVAKLVLECSKQRLRYLVLDLSWQFVVEVELFDDEVVIINESVLNKFFD